MGIWSRLKSHLPGHHEVMDIPEPKIPVPDAPGNKLQDLSLNPPDSANPDNFSINAVREPPVPSMRQPFNTPADPVPHGSLDAPQMNTATLERDVQVVMAKLDTIRAQLDNVLQRLERIEQGKKSEKYQW